MVSTKNTQSLTEFRQNATKTLARLNRTGVAEILTVNGQARAVLLPPDVYDDLTREALAARDEAVMRIALQQIEEGKGVPVDEAFRRIRKKVQEMTKPAHGNK